MSLFDHFSARISLIWRCVSALTVGSGLGFQSLLGGRFDGRFVKRIVAVVAAPLVISAIKQLQRVVVAHARCRSACLPASDEAF